MPTIPQRAAGWRIEPPVSVPIAQGASRPATAAAQPPEEPPGTRSRVPGVQDRAVAGVLVRGAHRELVHVRLAEHARAGLAQLADGGRRVGRAVALEDPRAGRGRDALGAEDVLDRDRDAAERASPSRRRPVPRSACAAPRRSTGRRSASRRRPPRDRRRSTRPRRARRSGSARPPRRPSARRIAPRITPAARGRGRRRRPGRAHAPAPRSRGQLGRGSSGRSTFSSATTCEVGSTPSRSSSQICSTCSRMPGELGGHPLDLLVGRGAGGRDAATWRTWSRSITRLVR